MILLSQVKLKIPINNEMSQLKSAISKTLKCNIDDIIDFSIYRKSIDARKKPELYYVYSLIVDVRNQDKALKKCKNASIYNPKKYEIIIVSNAFLEKLDASNNQIAIVGAGPAGLFAAYVLSLAGLKPHVYERGKDVDSRQKDIEHFFKTGILNTSSNVQFGEGGAGCFSDGKLNTLVKDKFGRNRFVLETFVKFGAPSEILYDAKPHIGTDILSIVIKNMRNEIIQLGGQFHFDSCVTDFNFVNNQINEICINNNEWIKTNCIVLAIGHSARDTFYKLYEHKVSMQAKAFACGFRVEHLQEDINTSQYGPDYLDDLPAARYKLAENLPNGRGVYSFCMCPGGYVVNSSSEEGYLTVNGMSYNSRDSIHSNAAIIVTVGENEFDMTNPLSGIEYQRSIEKKAYDLAEGKIPQQLYGDFKANKKSQTYGKINNICQSQVELTNLRNIYSEDINKSFIEAMEKFGSKIKGYNDDDTLLSGIEARTSSPVRILRDEFFMSNYQGLYPCGEGAGYAGGIMSAAMDGMKVAEAILNTLK